MYKFTALLLFITLNLTQAYASPTPYSDTPPRDIAQFEKQLVQIVEASDHLTLKALGTVKYDTFSNPLSLWLVTFKGDDKKKKKIFMSGGLHGDEPAGPASVLATIKEVSRNPKKYKHVNIDFIPMVNPSGWINRTRLTAGEQDINRDFHLQTSQEAMLINAFMQNRIPYKLMIDHHEDPRYLGFYIVTYNNPHLETTMDIIQKVKDLPYPTRLFKHSDGYFNVSKKMTPKLKNKTFMSFARTHYSRRAYQIESPTTPPMSDRIRVHTMADTALLNSIK